MDSDQRLMIAAVIFAGLASDLIEHDAKDNQVKSKVDWALATASALIAKNKELDEQAKA